MLSTHLVCTVQIQLQWNFCFQEIDFLEFCCQLKWILQQQPEWLCIIFWHLVIGKNALTTKWFHYKRKKNQNYSLWWRANAQCQLWNPLWWPNYVINSVDKTKWSCYTSAPMQHQFPITPPPPPPKKNQNALVIIVFLH